YRQLPSLTALWSDGRPMVDEDVPVKVSRVKRGTINQLLEGSGKIEPLTRVDVVSPIPGQVQEIRYKVGDVVAEGQVVATVRSKELLRRVEKDELSWKEAQAVLSEREKQLSEREEQLARARQFHKQDFISTRELEQAETAAETARAQHELAQAQLAQREAALAQSRYLLKLGRLVAPFSGVVARRVLEPGATVSPSTAILTLAGLDPLKVVVDLTEKDSSLVRKGMAARIRVDDLPDRLFEGKVVALNSTSEPANLTLQAEVQLSNRNRLLRPGMIARVAIVLGSDEALLVPAAAVIAEGGKNYVYVVVENKAMRRPVRKGWEQEGNLAIADGVSEGELIVVSGQQRLRPNSKVRVQEHTESRMEDRR
ncbi:MAG TPA: efflux RND transporter periplasmic adaptor subunit, partial [Candidatus Binatia bacterium]|nr:efflux RND transporter periplasmic adaptor subunit [Candidatus Binatia bacterium]